MGFLPYQLVQDFFHQQYLWLTMKTLRKNEMIIFDRYILVIARIISEAINLFCWILRFCGTRRKLQSWLRFDRLRWKTYSFMLLVEISKYQISQMKVDIQVISFIKHQLPKKYHVSKTSPPQKIKKACCSHFFCPTSKEKAVSTSVPPKRWAMNLSSVFFWPRGQICRNIQGNVRWESGNQGDHEGVSENSGTPKWMIYNGKPY